MEFLNRAPGSLLLLSCCADPHMMDYIFNIYKRQSSENKSYFCRSPCESRFLSLPLYLLIFYGGHGWVLHLHEYVSPCLLLNGSLSNAAGAKASGRPWASNSHVWSGRWLIRAGTGVNATFVILDMHRPCFPDSPYNGISISPAQL